MPAEDTLTLILLAVIAVGGVYLWLVEQYNDLPPRRDRAPRR